MLSANSAKLGSNAARGEASVLLLIGRGERSDVREEARIGVVGRDGGLEAREARFVDILARRDQLWLAIE